MSNDFDKIFQSLSQQLQLDEDRDLLRKLIEIQKTEGPTGVTKFLENTLEEMSSD